MPVLAGTRRSPKVMRLLRQRTGPGRSGTFGGSRELLGERGTKREREYGCNELSRYRRVDDEEIIVLDHLWERKTRRLRDDSVAVL